MNTASAVRRYRDEPVSDEVIDTCLRAASWAPSGGNQQPWKFIVLRSGSVRDLITAAAHQTWEVMTEFYRIEPVDDDVLDAKARVLATMAEHMRVGGAAPVLVLFCVQPQPGASELQQGGSIFPAVQNFLLAARAQGLGAAITLWHMCCEDELRSMVAIPDDWLIATLLTMGWPKGGHHQVRRRPLEAVAAIDRWDQSWRTTEP